MRKTGAAYPWWYDDPYLSIFFVDMLGNSMHLYNAWVHWDHIPHFHGPGALALAIAGAFGEPIISAIGIATLLHVILEIQEFYGDLRFHTHNVRDTQDTINDMLFGVLGVIVYGAIWCRAAWLQRKRAKPMKRPKA